MRALICAVALVGGVAFGQGFVPSSFRARFTQKIVGALHGRQKHSQGVFDYRRPGQVRFEMTGQQNLTVVSNPQTTWYYHPPFIEGQDGEVRISPTKKGSVSRFFDLLNQGLKSNSDYKVSHSPQGHQYTLSLSPQNQKGLRIRRAVLSFSPSGPHFASLKSLELIYTNDKRVFLHFSEIQPGRPFASAHFTFFPPPGTRVTKTGPLSEKQ